MLLTQYSHEDSLSNVQFTNKRVSLTIWDLWDVMKILTSVNFQKTAKKPEESIQFTGTAESLHISLERLHKRFPWQQDMKPLQGFCDPSSGEVYYF